MPLIRNILTFATCASFGVQALTVGRRNLDARMPDWNFANRTTANATPNGSVGVIIEPDLVVGKPVTPGATVTKLRFGPFNVRPGKTATKMISHQGPCRDCYITAMQVNLEDEKGVVANVDTGAWLHHIVLVAAGQKDGTCAGQMASFGGRRIYNGGNERVPVRMNSRRKYGLDLKNARLSGQGEVMSESSKPMTVYMTMLFEWVPKRTPGYRAATDYYVDVTNCGFSSFPARTGVYTKKGNPWTMKEDAYLLFATGHAHDGGVKVDLLQNGKVACSSKQLYANRRGGFVESKNASIIKSMVMPPGTHISDNAVCKDFGTVKKGDVMQVVAYYDSTTHMQMKTGRGGLEPQMGITHLYLGPM